MLSNLRGTDLGEASLRETDLGGADLGGANLSRANLGGTNLGGAENLTREQILSAKTYSEAKLPDYLTEQTAPPSEP